MHNTSSVWTAVTKQTQKPSQANSLSAAQSRGGGGFVSGTWGLSAGERSQSTVYMRFGVFICWNCPWTNRIWGGGDVLGRRQWRYFRKQRCMPETERWGSLEEPKTYFKIDTCTWPWPSELPYKLPQGKNLWTNTSVLVHSGLQYHSTKDWVCKKKEFIPYICDFWEDQEVAVCHNIGESNHNGRFIAASSCVVDTESIHEVGPLSSPNVFH